MTLAPHVPHRARTRFALPDRLAHWTERVAAILAVDEKRVLGPRRGPSGVARARQMVMYLAHVVDGVPQAEIAQAFGRDRTAVGYAVRVVEDLRDDPAIDAMLVALEGTTTAAGRER